MVMAMVMVIIEPGMFKRTMVAVSTTRLLALVHIITMGPVTLLMIVTFPSYSQIFQILVFSDFHST